jgi:hypothetical protein
MGVEIIMQNLRRTLQLRSETWTRTEYVRQRIMLEEIQEANEEA